MTTNRQPDTANEQLSLALPRLRPATLRPREVPAKLRLDSRTRQVGRAGIAELRRILSSDAAEAA